MQQLLSFLSHHIELAILFSIGANILISIIGIPSVFLTAFNVGLLGFWGGAVLSLIGEAVGAVVAFMLYRKGFRNIAKTHAEKYPKVKKLLHVHNREAVLLVISLRLLPFVPSSLVTLFAALGRMSLIAFAAASTIGKVPALWIEVYSVYEVLNWSGTGKAILAVIAVVLLLYVWRKRSI